MKTLVFCSLVVFLTSSGRASFVLITNPKKTWEEAKVECTNRGGTLAILNSDTKVSDARALISGSKVWVGLKHDGPTDAFQWADGTVANVAGKYNKVHHQINKKCYYLTKSGKHIFKFSDCDREEVFMCGIVSSTTVPATTLRAPAVTSTAQVPDLNTASNKASQDKTSSKLTTTLTSLRSTPELSTSVAMTTSREHVTLHSSVAVTTSVDLVTLTSVFAMTTSVDHVTPQLSVAMTTPSYHVTQASSVAMTTSLDDMTLASSATLTSSLVHVTIAPSVAMTTPLDQVTVAPSVASTPLDLATIVESTVTLTRDVNTVNSTVASSTGSPTVEKYERVKIEDLVRAFHKEVGTLHEDDPWSLQTLATIFDDLINRVEDVKVREHNNKTMNLMSVALDMEQYSMKYARRNLKFGENDVIHVSNKQVDIESVLLRSGSYNTSSIILSNGKIILPSNLLSTTGNTIIVNIIYNTSLLHPTFQGSEHSLLQSKTHIISSSLSPLPTLPFREPVRITFQHLKKYNRSASPLKCGYWDYQAPKDGRWSFKGCTVVTSTETRTTCACDHMTNFAVLMQLGPESMIPPEHIFALNIVSLVGLMLSLVGEVVTIIAYVTLLNMRHEKSQIRVNLVVNLALAQIVLLAGINETGNKLVCTTVAVLIQFFYTASFCWMFMEGVYLYRVIVKVFDSDIIIRYCYLFSYGFPAVTVISALCAAEFFTGGVYSYVNPQFCWVSSQNHLIWSFVGPVIMISGINLMILVSVIREMMNMPSIKSVNKHSVANLRASARACAVLLPLLGITWLFGLLSLSEIGVAIHYIFTVLNSTQGFMIFIFHCVRNAELRAAFQLKVFRWESTNRDLGSRSRTPTQRAGKKEKDYSQEMSAINKVMPAVT